MKKKEDWFYFSDITKTTRVAESARGARRHQRSQKKESESADHMVLAQWNLTKSWKSLDPKAKTNKRSSFWVFTKSSAGLGREEMTNAACYAEARTYLGWLVSWRMRERTGGSAVTSGHRAGASSQRCLWTGMDLDLDTHKKKTCMNAESLEPFVVCQKCIH